MTTIYKLFLPACIAVLAVACTSETREEKNDVPPPAEQPVTVNVTLGSLDLIETRQGLAVSEEGLPDPCWSAGDRLLVGDSEFELESFKGKTAVFKGFAPTDERFDIHYVSAAGSVTADAVGRQKSDGDISHLNYSASLLGVDSYEDIVFSYGWAAEHGGTFSQSGFMQLVLNLPYFVSGLSRVSFSVNGGEARTLEIENGTVNAHTFSAWFPCGELVFTGATPVDVEVLASDGCRIVASFNPAAQTLSDSHILRLVMSPDIWKVQLEGSGTEADPYLVSSAPEFCSMGELLALDTFTYFKMTADIDMKDVSDWSPVNLVGSAYGIRFDGGNHILRNFHYSGGTKWSSIFGFVYGKVSNLTVEDSSVSISTNTPTGLVAGYVGNVDGTLPGELENVHVVRGRVSTSVYAVVGGLAGRSGAGTFTNCSFDGTVERTGTGSYSSTYYPLGGVLGEALEGVSISGCSSSGALVASSGMGNGGILGKCEAALDLTDCHSEMTVTTRDGVAGGIVGYFGTGNILRCTARSDVSVSGAGSGNSISGGIAGHASGAVTVRGCRYDGTIKTYSGIVGGILGQCETSSGDGCTMSQCFSSGKIEATTIVGGLIARASNIGLKVSDCASSMDIAGTGPYVGGLIADVPKNSVITNSFASGSVTGSYAVGGFIGRAYGRQTASDNLSTDVNISVENCIAFNPSVRTVTSGGETPSNHYSGGAIIGCSSRPNTLKNCLRRSDMVFDFYKDASLNVLFDHADSSPSSPLAQPSGSAKWFSPYHGKAAPAGATLADLGRSLGWSEEVWSFDDGEPALR